MRIFAFDPEDFRNHYHRQGWVHIKDGIHPDFLAELRQGAERQSRVERLDRFAIKGKKEQALYEFPASTDYPEELFDAVASVCGLRRESMTLSERHIQIYDAEAKPDPQAHKDRFPSQVSVGLSIEIPQDSRLVLYPHDRREVNPFISAAALIRHLQPDELPDVALRHAQAVEIADRPGDVVMFPGSTTWHLRRHAAGAVNLYVKCNDFDCDPLGEDPRTAPRREHTVHMLATADREKLAAQPVKLSRRLDSVARRQTRDGFNEVLEACLYGSDPFGITETQRQILCAAGEAKPLEGLLEQVATDGRTREESLSDAIRLLELGALEILAEA
ncbi:MAG: hypothetical protein M3016_02590 [Actinomycetota bacterium]|nr:hypothetical protein [Actinomycetota bacterium]